MLLRLFKYEMKATARILVPIYLAFIAISGITRVSFEFQLDKNSPLYFLTDISTLIFTLSGIAICVTTAIVIIWRFYRNTSSDEGYLLFTLPVKADSIIISEFLCAFIWNVVMFIVCIIGIFLMIFNRNIDSIVVNFEYLGSLFSSLSSDGIKAIFITIAGLILSSFADIILCYSAIAIGSLFKKHRLLLSVVFYIALVVLLNFFDIILLQIITHSLVQETYVTVTYDMISLADTWNNLITPVMLSLETFVDSIYLIIVSIIQYFVIRFIFKKHLNIN